MGTFIKDEPPQNITEKKMTMTIIMGGEEMGYVGHLSPIVEVEIH